MSVISNGDMMHCTWDPLSAFSTTRPVLVNKRFVTYNFSNDDSKLICLCHTNKPKYCHNKDIGPSYPGQTINFDFIIDKNDAQQVLVHIAEQLGITCKHENDKSIVFQLENEKCKRIKYKVMYNYRQWCEFFLQVATFTKCNRISNTNIYHLITAFPKGFSLHLDGYCQCDTIL